MRAHTIYSPMHGELLVVTTEGAFDRGRTWRAILDPRPARLAHLVAVDGLSEADVLERMRTTVERYDAVGYQARGLTGPGHDESAPPPSGEG